MSLTRQPYEPCAYRHQLAETTGPGIYQLSTPPNTCQPCHPSDPYIRAQKTGVALTRNTPLADVDSELTGRSRNNSKCPERQFLPSLGRWGSQAQGFGRECDTKSEGFGSVTGGACRGPNVGTAAGNCNPNVSKVCVDNNQMFNPSDCSRPFTENTRISNPPSTLRGAGAANRWEWHARNWQSHVTIPYDFNINSVMIARDSHRPCIPRPFDQKAAWPKPHNQPMCETITRVPYNPTDAPSTQWQRSEVIAEY